VGSDVIIAFGQWVVCPICVTVFFWRLMSAASEPAVDNVSGYRPKAPPKKP